MSFNSKRPPESPRIPAQAAAPELMDFIDEISGVQTITTTGPDGKKRRVSQRLPLTPQEQQILDQAERLVRQSVDNIEKLYEYNPEAVANYQPFIKKFTEINNERMQDLAQIGNFKDIAEKVEQFRTINRDLAMREFESSKRASEEILGRRGIAKSTEASEYRAAMAREKALLTQQLDVNAQNYGEDLKSRQLGREAETYNIQEAGRQARLQEAEAGYELESKRIADVEAARQNAINENLQRIDLGNNMQGKSQKSEMALQGSNNALGVFNSQAQNANQRYANEVSRVTGQHRMDMDNFNNTPATFGRKLVDLGLSTTGDVAGRYLGSKISAVNNPAPIAPVVGGNYRRNQTFRQLSRLGR